MIILLPDKNDNFIAVEKFKQGLGEKFSNYQINDMIYTTDINKCYFNCKIKKIAKCTNLKLIVSLFYDCFIDIQIANTIDLEYRNLLRVISSTNSLEHYQFYGDPQRLSNRNIFYLAADNLAISADNDKLEDCLSEINGMLIDSKTKLYNGDTNLVNLPPSTYINKTVTKDNMQDILRSKTSDCLIFLPNTLFSLFRLAETENFIIRNIAVYQNEFGVFDKMNNLLGYFKFLPRQEKNSLFISGAILQENGIINFNIANAVGILTSFNMTA